MGLTETLKIIITGDSSSAVGAIKKVGTTADQELTKATNKADKFGTGLQKGGALAVGFAAVTGAALIGTAKVFEEHEKAERKFQNTMKNAPALAHASAKGFHDLADSIRNTTVVDDEAALGVIALLGQYRATEVQIHSLVPLIVDFSRKMGIDLDTATKAVGKSLDGNVGGLRRMGIGVDATRAKTDAFGATMDALKGTVGGFAQEEATTFSGKLAILKNQLSEVAEGIGGGVVDALTSLTAPLTEASKKFTELPVGVQSTIGKVGAFGTVAVGAGGAVAVLAGSLVRSRDNLTRFGAEFPRTTAVVGTLARTIGVLGGALAVGALLSQLGESANTATGDIGRLSNEIRDFNDGAELTGLLADRFGGGMDEIAAKAKRVQGALKDQSGYDAATEGAAHFIEGLTPLRNQTTTAENDIDDLDKAFADLASKNLPLAEQKFALVSAALEKQGLTAKQIAGIFDDYSLVVADSANATDDFKTGLDGTDAAADGAAGGIDDLGQSITDYRKAVETATTKQKDFNDAVFGRRADAEKVEADILKFKDGLKEYGEKAKDSKTSSDDLRLAQLDLQGQIRDTAKDAGDAAFEQAKLAGKSDAAGIAADAQKAALYKLALTLAPGSPLRVYVDGLIGDLDRAGKIHANPTLDLTVSINGQKVPIAAVNSAIGAGGQFIRPQGRMAGGPVSAGQIYTVGEAGPELFMSTTGGNIIPNGRGVSTGGGNTYQLTVVSIDPTKAGDAVVAALREYERSNGRVPIKVA